MIVSLFRKARETIHMTRTLTGAVAAINSFRGQMEQIIFDRSYLLRPATFLEDVSHSNISHPSLEAVYLFSL